LTCRVNQAATIAVIGAAFAILDLAKVLCS
jgi:hypothetical protein